MSIESGRSLQKDVGSFQSCLVEGSGEQRAREKRIRRRALAISIATQCAIVTAIVMIPLFGKPERLAFAMTPIPPYYHSPENPSPAPHPAVPRRPNISPDFFSMPQHIPQQVDEHAQPASPEPPGIPSGPGPGTPCPGCIPLVDTRVQPERPADARQQTPPRLHVTRLEQAMLIQRIEPLYPPLRATNSSRRPGGIARHHRHRRHDQILASGQRRSTLLAVRARGRTAVALPPNRSQRPARGNRYVHHRHLQPAAVNLRRST